MKYGLEVQDIETLYSVDYRFSGLIGENACPEMEVRISTKT